MAEFEGIKVFTASMMRERDGLSHRVNRWLAKNEGAITIVDKEVKQSSDAAYHCLSIVLFYRGKARWDEPSSAQAA